MDAARTVAAAWTVLRTAIWSSRPKAEIIQTKRNFGDCQLHIEWCTPENVSDTGQLRSNSGVFLQSLYEVQILDSYLNDTYWNGQAGSIYKQYAPLVNATKAPGQWNVYDIIYTAPRFNADGSLLSAARITVLQNGVLVQNNTTIKGTTFLEHPAYTAHGDAPIMLQDHGNAVPLPQHLDPGTVAPDRDKRSANAYNPDHHTRQAPM